MTRFCGVVASVIVSAVFAQLAHRHEMMMMMMMTPLATVSCPLVGLYVGVDLGALTLALAPLLARLQHQTAPVSTADHRPWHRERHRMHAWTAVHVAVLVSMHLIFSMLCVPPVEQTPVTGGERLAW